MDVQELGRLIGAKSGKAEYLPVAFLLKTGYACYGHYNSTVNEGMERLVVLLNVRLIDLTQSSQKARPTVRDFSDFLEDIVIRASRRGDEAAEGDDAPSKKKFGKSIPIAAVALNDIAVVYPVAQISALLRRARERSDAEPSALLDFSKSEILAVLRMKLW